MNKSTLALFNKLVCKPGDTTQWKKQIGYNVAEDYDNADTQIVSCDASGNKYALDKAVGEGRIWRLTVIRARLALIAPPGGVGAGVD